MDVINNLDNQVKAAIQRLRSQRASKETQDKLEQLNKDVDGIFIRQRAASEELERKRKPVLMPVTNITSGNRDEIFEITESASVDHWILTPAERCAIPEHLRLILNDYDMGAPKNEALMRTKIDAILLTTLASIKKRESYSHRRDSTCSVRSIRFQMEKDMKLPWNHPKTGEQRLVSGRTDYSLWYGTPGDMEDNLLFCEANETGDAQALIYMSMLHHARKRARREDTSVYGIATDSIQWTFIYLDRNSVYSKCTYQWKASSIEIVSIITKIIKHAGSLATVKSRYQHKSRSIEEMSGLQW